MCGIFGMAGFSDKALLRKMGRLVNYRGPDDKGYFTDSGIGLGMRRLSIIDVKKGRQPVSNEDGSIHVVFNGEIYNYRQLSAELENKGHKFYTKSDTEAIVHTYEEYGMSFVQKLNGMFAIALWDSKKKTLVIARDGVGEKPLYYTMIGKDMIFASEIKALLLHEGIERKVNENVLNHYLTLRYCPGHETMLKGVFKLPPWCMMIYRKGNVKMKRFWSLRFKNAEKKSESYYVDSLKWLLLDSVRSRLVSEVPLGVYLSGGLDSTAIVSLMKDAGAEDIKTFSIGFGLDSDETGWARMASEFYGTAHKEFVVSDTNMAKLLPKLVWHLDEPLADITNIPTYLISELARKHVTVVLSGEGSDELFSSYAHEKGMLRAERMKLAMGISKRLSGAMKHMPVSFFDKFFEYPGSMGEKGRERLAEFMKNSGDLPRMYSSLVSTFDENEKKELRGKFGAETAGIFRKHFALQTSLSNRMLSIDTKMWLPNYILLRVDKMTMANSIEARAPFLDHRLLEFAASLPENMKLRGNTEKYVLRKCLKGRLPPEIAKRKKRTFITPMHMWGERQLLDMCNILYESEFFRKPFIEKVVDNYGKSKLIRERQLWTLLTFELWHRTFIRNGDVRSCKL